MRAGYVGEAPITSFVILKTELPALPADFHTGYVQSQILFRHGNRAGRFQGRSAGRRNVSNRPDSKLETRILSLSLRYGKWM